MMIQKKNFIKELKNFQKNKNFILITSKRYLDDLPQNIDKDKLVLISFADVSEIDPILKKIKFFKPEFLVAYGSGKVIDVSKYTSRIANIDLIAVPTCLSTNCPFTDKSTLYIKGKRTTLDSKVPKKIILDWKIIKNNDFMNLCGNIELLSSLTSLTDWIIAEDHNSEKIDTKIYKRTKKNVIASSQLFFTKNRTNLLKKQSELLRRLGDFAVEYGCGRPVSGSEHVFATLIENHYGCPHGLALSITVPIVLRLQEKMGYKQIINDFDSKFIRNFPFKSYTLSNMDKETVSKLLLTVKPRKDRYSVINLVDKKDLLPVIKTTLDDIFN